MRCLVVAVLVAVSPVFAAYSGTFLDDFSDGNLNGWDILGIPRPLVQDLVRLEGGHLVLDTTLGRNEPPAVESLFEK